MLNGLRYELCTTYPPMDGKVLIDLSAFPEGYFPGTPVCSDCIDLTDKGTPAKWLVIDRHHKFDLRRASCWFWCGCTLDT